MKRLRDIRRASGITIEDASVHGGIGTIRIGTWTGSVIWGENEDGWEHVSVAPFDHTVIPSWDDMCRIKDIFFEDEEIVLQIHPKKSMYVNKVKNCLHLWRPKSAVLLNEFGGG